MRKTEKVLAGAGVLMAVGGGIASAYLPSLYPSFAAAGLSAGGLVFIIGVASTGWAMFHREPQAKAERVVVGDSYHNSGNNYGHMGPIHIGRPTFELTPEHVRQVLSRLITGRPVLVQAVGNQRAWTMGTTLVAAISAAGHTVVQRNIGMLSPPPDGPLSISQEGNVTCVTIAPNA